MSAQVLRANNKNVCTASCCYSGLAGNVVLLLFETLGMQVCSGSTGHAEVVQVTYDKAVIAYEDLLQVRAHTVSFG